MNALANRSLLSFLYPPRLLHTSSVTRGLSSLSSVSHGGLSSTPRATRGLATGWAGDPLNDTVGRLNVSLSQNLQAKNEQSAKQLWEYGSKEVLLRLASSPPPTPYTGRSVAVKGEAFAAAYRGLNGILRDNAVRATVRGQERHEKKGVKRRRLVSKTHRRKFGQLVRSKVAMVKKIRALGS
ncbi:hypothetical protein M407DRAFT_243772 [Tulasnella calospora MUT 4182]|uniref:Ribosomal protein S21 n=1 Tax=Tulasnella calospora MUT 4182 TaxID=1051891 RepID=A0A0C3Q8V0_9AGAM|nr:hypothetical protein M407DRAFT_243772 [Tulasnella calospora MUT 4182]